MRDQRKDRFSLSHFAGTQGKSRGFDIGFEQALLCLVQMIAFQVLLLFFKNASGLTSAFRWLVERSGASFLDHHIAGGPQLHSKQVQCDPKWKREGQSLLVDCFYLLE